MSNLVKRGTAPGRHVYDVIVIGGQLAGVFTSALLARHGLQVLHVPHDGSTEPWARGPLRLEHAPFLMPPPRAVPVLDELLNELGVGTTFARALTTSPLQLLQAERRFELTHDERRRGPELSRVLGDGAEAWDELLRRAERAGDAADAFFAAKLDFPPEGFFARWRFKRQLPKFQGLDATSPLPKSELLNSLLPFVQSAAQPPELTRARVLGRVLQGPLLHPQGREGVWQLLAERARELGADVISGTETVERLVLERNTVGVRLSRADTIFRAGFLVSALDLDALAPLVPDKQRPAAQKLALPVTSALVTFHLELPERALPRGLGALCLLEAAGLQGGAALLQVHPGAAADQRVLSVTVSASPGLRAGGEVALKALESGVHAALATVMPFTRQHVTSTACSWLDAPNVSDGRFEPQPQFQLPAAAWLGVTGLSTSSPWKRVLFANRQVLPALGLEGEVLAARRAAGLIERALKKNDPLKRKSA